MDENKLKDLIEMNVQGHLPAIQKLIRGNAKEIKNISKRLNVSIKEAVDMYVNGKINRLHDRFDEFEEKNDEQDKKIDTILDAVKWVGTLGKVITTTGKVTGSVVVIVGAIWAFLKFIALNLKF